MSDQTFTQQFLAEWADRWKIVCVTAQNIYDLHKRAGSRNVYPAHGGYKRRKRCSTARSALLRISTRRFEAVLVDAVKLPIMIPYPMFE